MEPNDKLNISSATFTLVENGEKVVHFAINDGDKISVEDPSNPGAEPITFEMGEQDDPETNEDENEDDEAEDSQKSAAVQTLTQPTEESTEPDEQEPPGEEK